MYVAHHRSHNDMSGWFGILARSRTAQLVAALVFMLILYGMYDKEPDIKKESLEGVGTGPTYEKFNDTEVVWEAPRSVKGVLFVAHGCNHGAIDFWPKSLACPACIGLPEELLITRTALSRGYAVVAISSHDRQHSRCWQGLTRSRSKPEMSSDFYNVASVLGRLRSRQHWDSLPLYALGASSGGAFVLMLPQVFPVSGVVAEIMAVDPSELEAYFRAHSVPGQLPYPPVMFVHMPRDGFTAGGVEADARVIMDAKVPTKIVEVHPRPLTPSWLHERCAPEISGAQSEAIYNAMKSANLLDVSGKLVSDPRQSNWRELLEQRKVAGLETIRVQADESPLSEELNVLWAGHEIVGDIAANALTWLEEQTKQLAASGTTIVKPPPAPPAPAQAPAQVTPVTAVPSTKSTPSTPTPTPTPTPVTKAPAAASLTKAASSSNTTANTTQAVSPTVVPAANTTAAALKNSTRAASTTPVGARLRRVRHS